jgi:hypothetical protein
VPYSRRDSRGLNTLWVLERWRGTWIESRKSGSLLRIIVIGNVEPLDNYRERNKGPQYNQDGERMARHAGRKG